MDLGWLKYLIPGTSEKEDKELALLKQRKAELDTRRRGAYKPVFSPTPDERAILDGLHPVVRPRVLETLQDATFRGLFVVLFCGIRTFDESDKLYKRGRNSKGDIVDIKKVVTNAKPGYSWHNYAAAVDIVMNIGPRDHLHLTWDDFVDANKDMVNDWVTLGDIGKSHGLSWGGNFKTLIDVPHFQYHYGFELVTDALTLYNTSSMDAVWARIK